VSTAAGPSFDGSSFSTVGVIGIRLSSPNEMHRSHRRVQGRPTWVEQTVIHPDTELRFVSDEIGYGVFATALIPRGTR
jgi:hypothetical protein